jgi:hypothetical protein
MRDAALLTLEVQTHASEMGFTLRDASAYNVQFLRGKPVLIVWDSQTGAELHRLEAQARSVKDHDNEAYTRLDTEFHIMLCEFHDNRTQPFVVKCFIQRANPRVIALSWKDESRKRQVRRAGAQIEHALVAGQLQRPNGADPPAAIDPGAQAPSG